MSIVLEKLFLNKNPLFTRDQAITESARCLNCFDAPCTKACPTNIDVAKFINQIYNDNIRGSANTILIDNILGYSCGRVCPVEVLCESACVYHFAGKDPIKIGKLQEYSIKTAVNRVGFVSLFHIKKIKKVKKIALIGSGPSSLAAAAELVLNGHKAIIFEQKSIAGGLNSLGVAPYKLTKYHAQQEINWLLELGLKIRINTKIKFKNNCINNLSFKNLINNYDAIFLGIGNGKDSFLNINNADCSGIIGALDLIEKIKTQKTLSLKNINVAHIIGGGNTAIDVAYELRLLGVNKVIILYRKSKKYMSGYSFELKNALKSGVHFVEYSVIEKIFKKQNKLVGIRVKNIKLNKIEIFSSDLLVLAIGQTKNHYLSNNNFSIDIDCSGSIVVNPLTSQIMNTKIFAAGDCVNGGKEVVDAVYGGKMAAKRILKYLDM